MYKIHIFRKYNKWFTLLELLIVLIIIGVIMSIVNFLNFSQIENIKQNSKIDSFVSNYNQILLYCMTNNCENNERKISNGSILYPTRQNTKLQKIDWLDININNQNSLTLKYNNYACDSQDTQNLSFDLKNINNRWNKKCFEIDRKCKLYTKKCI